MEKKELLGQLRDTTECMIISDLKYVDVEILYMAVSSLNEEEFTVSEWHDAINYLTGNDIDKQIGKTGAKEYLCNYYRK